jgi:hypothetical protein
MSSILYQGEVYLIYTLWDKLLCVTCGGSLVFLWVLYAFLCNKVCTLPAAGWWFLLGTLIHLYVMEFVHYLWQFSSFLWKLHTILYDKTKSVF